MKQLTERFSRKVLQHQSFQSIRRLYYVVIVAIVLVEVMFFSLLSAAISLHLKFLFIFLMGVAFLIWMIWIQVFFGGAYYALTEELDPIKAIKLFELRKIFPQKKLPTVALVESSYCYLICGEYDTVDTYLREAEERWFFRHLSPIYKLFHAYLSLSLDLSQGKVIHIEDYERAIETYPVKSHVIQVANRKRLNHLQAVSDIKAGISNDYFETSERATLLEELIADYYRARNACLKGELGKAKDLLARITPYPDRILVVRQAKQLLQELD